MNPSRSSTRPCRPVPLLTLGLTQTSSSSVSPNDTFIVIDIGDDDLDNLKRLTRVATSRDDAYLSLNYTAIQDMNTRAILQISGSNALQVTNFVRDGIRPVLTNFSLDVNAGVLVLTFSETVEAETLNISSITLQSATTVVPGERVRLEEGLEPELSSSNSTDDPILTVFIGSADLNAVKRIFELANALSSTFLTIDDGGISDMVGLPVRPVEPDSALPAGAYAADTVGPELLSFGLNLTSELLVLTFDETVNVDSFSVARVVLLSVANTSYSVRVLTDHRSLSRENSTVLSFLLAVDDLDTIKLDTELATSPDNTHLRLLPFALQDMAFAPNFIQPSVTAVLEEDYEEDRVDPALLNFAVDMNLGLLVLNFDEPVDASSLQATGITLLLSSSEVVGSGLLDVNSTNATITRGGGGGGDTNVLPTKSFQLTNGSTNSSNGRQIVVVLTEDDLNAVKQDEGLYANLSTSYLAISPDVVADMNGNQVQAVAPSNALPASDFVNDTTSPFLESFDLDMDAGGLLLLTFSETVDVSTAMFRSLVLQRGSNVSSEASRYMLTGGALTMIEDGLIASVRLTLEDLNELKRRRIAVSRETAWLLFDETAILDMNDREVVPLLNGVNTVQVRNYRADETPPQLQGFELDLTEEILTLNFTETVDVFFFNVTSLVLQDTSEGNNTFNHFRLTASSLLNASDDSVIEVALGREDLDEIKALYELATEEENTFLRIDSELVEDVFGNNVVEIFRDDALVVDMYRRDAIDPVLETFDLDLDERVVTLYFSETVGRLHAQRDRLYAGRDDGGSIVSASFELQSLRK